MLSRSWLIAFISLSITTGARNINWEVRLKLQSGVAQDRRSDLICLLTLSSAAKPTSFLIFEKSARGNWNQWVLDWTGKETFTWMYSNMDVSLNTWIPTLDGLTYCAACSCFWWIRKAEPRASHIHAVVSWHYKTYDSVAPTDLMCISVKSWISECISLVQK